MIRLTVLILSIDNTVKYISNFIDASDISHNSRSVTSESEHISEPDEAKASSIEADERLYVHPIGTFLKFELIKQYKTLHHITNALGYGSLAHSNIFIKSVIKSGISMLGVFTNIPIPAGSLVTTYGGEIRHITEFTNTEDKSHAMRLHGNDSHLALCGRRFAQEFCRIHKDDIEIRLRGGGNNEYYNCIMNSGCGYMINHAARYIANCRIVHVIPGRLDFEQGYHGIPCIVTKRYISIYEELTYFYGSWVAKNNFFLS